MIVFFALENQKNNFENFIQNTLEIKVNKLAILNYVFENSNTD